MRRPGLRTLLFGVLFFALPLPLFGLEQGFVPAARAAMLGGVCLGVLLLENANGVAGLLAAIFLLQAMLQAALLWGLSSAVLRSARGLRPASRRALVVGLIAVVLSAGLTQPLYRTPFHARTLHATLLEVYE